MRIPKKLKIKTKTFDVEYDKYLLRDQGKYGVCWYHKQKIVLDNTQHREHLEKTFFHELIHAVMDTSGLRHLSGEVKEKITTSLGEDLLLAIRENNLDLR